MNLSRTMSQCIVSFRESEDDDYIKLAMSTYRKRLLTVRYLMRVWSPELYYDAMSIKSLHMSYTEHMSASCVECDRKDMVTDCLKDHVFDPMIHDNLMIKGTNLDGLAVVGCGQYIRNTKMMKILYWVSRARLLFEDKHIGFPPLRFSVRRQSGFTCVYCFLKRLKMTDPYSELP
ncbi:TPA_asm: P4 [Arceuthobium sichuanense virus 2]|uniref:Protein 4 n=1 Tax=Picea virus 1 TaxID=2977979 RepID=A0A9N6YIX5_9RHAB|nr:TPA_asm: P4 [Arceuthobium sichuanense virus 2]DAZ90775.1 TPA_asm: protein 4 [Picea virus 1]